MPNQTISLRQNPIQSLALLAIGLLAVCTFLLACPSWILTKLANIHDPANEVFFVAFFKVRYLAPGMLILAGACLIALWTWLDPLRLPPSRLFFFFWLSIASAVSIWIQDFWPGRFSWYLFSFQASFCLAALPIFLSAAISLISSRKKFRLLSLTVWTTCALVLATATVIILMELRRGPVPVLSVAVPPLIACWVLVIPCAIKRKGYQSALKELASSPHCPHCSFNLTGNPAATTCPECGHPLSNPNPQK